MLTSKFNSNGKAKKWSKIKSWVGVCLKGDKSFGDKLSP